MIDLKKYNEKRDFTKTKEPLGKKETSKKKLRFAIQHHLASHDHYDLRLECAGVLLSWAIPKGPSFNPKDKRLAVNVENHPLSYRNFEGTIPKGAYGAGTVMLWDEGYYVPTKNIKKAFEEGIIKFTLNGKRLKGAWSLVKFKNDNWLLIKEKDTYAKKTMAISQYTRSIKTNRTMQEISTNKKAKTSKKEAIVCDIKITHPNKIIFKNPKITKLDIALYYHKIAPKMLPIIKNRLFSTIRMPNENKEKFYMKHFPTNPYLGKKTITNSKGQKETYFYIKDEKGLIYEVQNNSYEFHIWGSTVNKINSPDVMVLDLDPDKNVSLKEIRQAVKEIRKTLMEFSLKSSLKTSGGKGYHIIVPIDKNISWQKLSTISKKIAELMESINPNLYTSNIRMASRKNKIFIDWQRNIKGATFVAPYSLRLKDKPTISMPISWKNLDTISPNSVNLTNINNINMANN